MKCKSLLLKVVVITTLYSCKAPLSGQQGSQNANKNTVIRYFDEVINKHSVDKIGEFFLPDYAWHQIDGKEVHSSRDSSHIFMMKFIFNAIPDIRYTVENTVAEGDMIAVNSTVTGTAKGEFFGVQASQKKVQFKQMFFFRLANKKITEEWEVVDVAGIKEQLSKP